MTKLQQRDKLILKMLAAFEKLGRDPMARIDARIWFEHYRRRVRRLGLGRPKAGAGSLPAA